MLGRRQMQPGQSVLRAIHLVALEGEVIGQIGQNVAVVLYHQQSHRRLIPVQQRQAYHRSIRMGRG